MSAIFDFAGIRKRMLGELKAKPKPPTPCDRCQGAGWVYDGWKDTVMICSACGNPKKLQRP